MMKKLLLSLLAACAFGTSWGQDFSASVNEIPKSTYEVHPATFSTADIADKLGITANDLVTAFGNNASTPIVFLNSNGTLSSSYDAGQGGFYMTADGQVSTWASIDEAGVKGWYNTFAMDATNTTFNIGQFPGRCEIGDSYTAHYVIKVGSAQATIDITLNIVADPLESFSISQLNITDGGEVICEEYPKSDWSNETFSFDVSAAVAATGLADLQANFQNYIYVKDFDNQTEVSRKKTADGTGWWLNPIDTDTKLGECASKGFDGNGRFFAAGFAFDGTNMTFYAGQMPNALAVGNSVYTYLYILNPETKAAYRVKVTMNIIELPVLLSEHTIVNSTPAEVTVEMPPMTTFTPATFSVNISDAAALLGITTTDLQSGFASSIFSKQWNAEKTTIQDNLIGGGNFQYWAAEGEAEVAHATWSWEHAYGITEMTCDGSSITGKLNQIPGRLTAGQSFYNYMYLIVGTNAYQIKVNLNVVEPSLDDMTEAGTKSITLSQVISQATATTYDMTTDTPTLAEIATALGCQTGELRLYALDAEGKLSSNHTANNGGYWMDKDGRICGWATENCGLFVEPVSVSDCSTLTIGQFDNAYTEPTTWTTTLYIVNTSDNNYYTLNLTVNLTMGDISLSENDTELADINGQRANVELSRTFFEGWNTLVLPFDISMGDLLRSTGLEVVEIGTFAGDELTDETYHIHFNKLANDVTLVANTPYLIKFSGNFNGDITVNNAKINIGEPVASGTNFDFVGTYVKGELIGADDYYVGKENSFWKSTQARTTKGFRAFLKAKSKGAPARIAFEFDNGEATAIQTLDGEDVNAEQGEWYTLAGQRIAAPAHRGLYIKNGKKYFVK